MRTMSKKLYSCSPHEFLGSLLDRLKATEVKLKKDRLFTGGVFQLVDRGRCSLFASGCHIYFGIVEEEESL